MSTSICQFANFEIAYCNLNIEHISESLISIGNNYFNSKILANLLKTSHSCFVYCIYPSCPVCAKNYTHEELEKAEEHLLLNLRKELSNPKCINPGVIYDWHLSSAEKMLEMLEIKKVKYDSFTNTMIPYQTKIGFVFDAPHYYLGNCQFCRQESCEYRSYDFNDRLLKGLHEK